MNLRKEKIRQLLARGTGKLREIATSEISREKFQRIFTGDTPFERRAIPIVVAVGTILAILILFTNKGGSSGSHEDGHGDEHGEHEKESGAVELSEEAIASSGIKVEMAQKAAIKKVVTLRGRVAVNRDKYAQIGPRYPGTVQRVFRSLGENVNKGDVLATIESAAARATFEVRSGISGSIVERRAVRGGFVPDKEAMFTIVDLDTVWAELNAPDTDFTAIRAGQKIRVLSAESGHHAEATVSYISPYVFADTQAFLVRAVLDNKAREWRPGTFIEAEIFSDEKPASVTVRREAIQSLENKPVVFVRNEEGFEARFVRLGDNDRQLVEIIEGMEDGDNYVSENSYIVKAELLKSSAAHEH